MCIRDSYRNGHTGSYTLVTPKGKLHFAGLRDLIPVSYTHLDVYKRQERGMSVL